MAIDLLAIADALATRFGAITPPSGEPAIVGSTARLPNGLPDTPYILVMPPEGTTDLGTGYPTAVVRDVHEFDVYLLLHRASGDLPTDIERVYKWWAPMRYAVFSADKLGLAPIVLKARVTDDYEFDSFEYEGQTYHAWRFGVKVWTSDTVTVTI